MSRELQGQRVVVTSQRGRVRIITLNRPDVRNAIDMQLRLELLEALTEANKDNAVRAVVLTGAGNAFCAGGDVSTMERMPPERARPRAAAAQAVVRAIWQMPKPVVAAVSGPAYGAGASLALACDRVVADASARFSMAFLEVGLAGDMGIFASLPARVGAARAKQMLLFPEAFEGADARDIGLVDVLEPGRGTALRRAVADAHVRAAGPAEAQAVMKHLLGVSRDRQQILELELEHQVKLFDSDDFDLAVRAFAQRRAR